MDDCKMKRCSVCGLEKPLEEFSLVYDKRRDKRYRCSICRKCGAKRARQWRQQNPDKVREYSRRYAADGRLREASKRYQEKHREEICRKKREYRKTHAEQIAAYERSRRATPEKRDELYARAHRWRSRHKAEIREYNKRYTKANLDRYRQAYHKRNALKRRLPSDFTQADWRAAKAAFGQSCAYCGRKVERLTQDHVVPVSAGGAYTRSNIVPACRRCNSSKHDTKMEQWYRKQPFYTKAREVRIKVYLARQVKRNAGGRT